MNRVIKKYCIHIALCWLAVLLSVFLTPGLSVRAVETVNNGRNRKRQKLPVRRSRNTAVWMSSPEKKSG